MVVGAEYSGVPTELDEKNEEDEPHHTLDPPTDTVHVF